MFANTKYIVVTKIYFNSGIRTSSAENMHGYSTYKTDGDQLLRLVICNLN
jgi:hypothetical protein